MNVKDYLNLYLGIIINPSQTFDYIIRKKLLIAGIAVWLLYAILSFFTLYLAVLQGSQSGKILPNFVVISYFITRRVIFAALLLGAAVFLENTFAVKFYKLKSSYLELLICCLFTSVLSILNTCFQIFLGILGVTSYNTNTFSLVFFGLWGLILHILIIKRVYHVSTGMAVTIFLFSIIVMFIVMFVLMMLRFI